MRGLRDIPRHRWLVVAAVWAACALAAGVFLLLEGHQGEVHRRASWTLLGVADGGRSLLVRTPDHAACEHPEIRASELPDGRIFVQSSLVTPVGTYDCLLALISGTVVRLRLGRPVDGRPVVGPRRRPPQPYFDGEPPVGLRRPAARTPPEVAGLRFRDARAALCTAGFQADRRGPVDGMTIAVSAPRDPRPQGSRPVPRCTDGTLPRVTVRTAATGD
ncbi:hypothetical protein [Patulibacter sp. SYSU D01012]|uniref:hypothetical protein n=1 Tax=Patulibacter sp. SYSU D01012 TaxID=2817381 RepID=UPI001B311B6B|nr:hypothetical protein [Patulibacter sp. SYSU D01012]